MIPFIDLKQQQDSIRQELVEALLRTLDSRQFALGEEVLQFEQEFASYCQVPHAIGVNSGTSALHLALLAAGLQPGDEVITVPFTFIGTAGAICQAGGRPVFVDIEPGTYTMDPALVEDKITAKTRVLLPVHLFGQPADMDPLLQIARRHNLLVIEDAAQAHGALYRQRRAGSLGDLGCFSFYPSKNLGACGEGGAVTTSREELAVRIRWLRDWSQERRYVHQMSGFNARMDGFQGAVLRVKLSHLDSWNRARQAVAATYHKALSETTLALPAVRKGSSHVYHLYCVRTARRDRLADLLTRHGIGTGVHYPLPLHLQPAFLDLGHREGDFPIAESCSQQLLSLPMFPHLSEESVYTVASKVREFEASALRVEG
jgi:dTDP-4-amino-4,6-dideoxygalactose transaminase